MKRVTCNLFQNMLISIFINHLRTCLDVITCYKKFNTHTEQQIKKCLLDVKNNIFLVLEVTNNQNYERHPLLDYIMKEKPFTDHVSPLVQLPYLLLNSLLVISLFHLPSTGNLEYPLKLYLNLVRKVQETGRTCRM